jgi:hypothetical protein
LRGFAPKKLSDRTNDREKIQQSAILFRSLALSTHFDVAATQKRSQLKPDNTQTGQIEIR